jgi:hypothetical protein
MHGGQLSCPSGMWSALKPTGFFHFIPGWLLPFYPDFEPASGRFLRPTVASSQCPALPGGGSKKRNAVLALVVGFPRLGYISQLSCSWNANGYCRHHLVHAAKLMTAAPKYPCTKVPTYVRKLINYCT